MEIINKTVYQHKVDKKLTELFRQGAEDYISFKNELRAVEEGKRTYEDFVKEFGGYNRGLGYTDFNYKSITATIYDETPSLYEGFTVWDDAVAESYELDIKDWI